ncbi:MAG: homocysteine S-methyltransferase family protein [Geminicoccaceae bacterium]|nr:homocysteine S-methyltransferase family protein [Geminicoccaceae bacterium]
MGYGRIKARLDAGRTIILDGGTGTELEKRGAPMNEAAWCGLVAIEQPELLESVHADYIEAGADVITANTFASSRLMLEVAGAADRVQEIATAAVETAKRARDQSGREIAIAGSLSHMVPVASGTDNILGDGPDTATMQVAFEELAEALVTGGAELIILEMMYFPERMKLAIDAALATGLPVWCGLSARSDGDGRLLSFSRQKEIPFADVIASLPETDFDAVGVMHTHLNDIAPALRMLDGRGPLMAYPDSGYFAMPNWQFVDIATPEGLVAHARNWQNLGTLVLGGCCGIGVEHIRALSALRND